MFRIQEQEHNADIEEISKKRSERNKTHFLSKIKFYKKVENANKKTLD